MAAGKLLKESDQWGGCLATEDPSVAREELDHNPLPTPRITPVEPAPNAQPSHIPFSPPNSYPSRHPSQQPMNELSNLPPRQPILPNQLPQYASQPGVQQPFYPYGAPQPQPFPTGIPYDENIYRALIFDMAQRGLLGSYPGGPSLGPGLQNGVPPLGVLPQGVNPMVAPIPLQNHHLLSQPPGLIPVAHQYSASPPISAPQSPSISRRPSVDFKGKGKATLHASSGKSDGIFTSESGEPLTFYVAIDVKKRADILQHIRRNGGKILTQTTADFVILYSRSKDFDTLLETVVSSNGTAVKPTFVLDSVAQNTLLDSSQYEYELPKKLLRKVPKSASPSAANARRAKKAVAVKKERYSPELSRPHLPSPSPPPEHNRMPHYGHDGQYRYTIEEDQYALLYCKILFARDRTMTQVVLANKLHAKCQSWGNRIAKDLRDDIEQLRKRADIAWRKEQHQQSQQSNLPPAKRRKLSGEAEQAAADFEHDLNAVAHFFAKGIDVDVTGTGTRPIGKNLQKRTEAGGWAVFYNNHHAKVSDLYQMLVSAQTQDGSN
ncbi:hypothetical protein B0H12DRAFT_1236009 [Mycena haematopus]|nr:hypothetical protein B0H12DRAFT_1236009 [Mycena haematopus]